MEKIKCISLWQPWASLVVLGHKKIETRGYNTKHRGPLLIHATQNRNVLRSYTVEQQVAQEAYWKYKTGLSADKLPFGAIIGCVNVVGSAQAEYYKNIANCVPLSKGGKIDEEEWKREMAFGDYSAGRYGWLLSDPLVFKDPIPAKGMQGFWMPDDITMLIVKIAIAEAKINP